ncbi:MAG: TonB-dependent receptor [Calditrichaeota bacterium]|nr:TonB-dependent receptor [Calditrichota bacterium]
MKIFYAFSLQKEHRRSGFATSLLSFFLTLLLLLPISAQDNGTIAGILVDAANGEPLIGANVYIEGATLGAASDIEGAFVITGVPAGSYTVVVDYVGYATTTVTNVAVNAGATTKLEIGVKSQLIEADEVVVEARLLENNEASLLKKRQKSDAVSDAVSAEQFSRTGSGDAAEAVKQVVGATVVDGKYVYVRGLGDRYSNTQLNGVELPSSDPYKQSFQLDLLPTNLLDNITTIKTFTPDKPGNFSGGVVDVNTKSFPDERTFKVSYSTAYKSNVNYNGDFVTYAGGNNDWMGYDDGTRALPDFIANTKIGESGLPNNATQVRNELRGFSNTDFAAVSAKTGKAFGSTMSTLRNSVPLNQGFSLSYGDQNKLGKTSSIGYSASLTYGRSFNFYEGGQINFYTLNRGASEFNPQLLLEDAEGSEEASLGGLGSFAYNINPQHQISGNLFYSRSGTSAGRFQRGSWPQELSESKVVTNHVLTYQERDVASYQLRGKHNIKSFLNSTLEWSGALSRTTQSEPDRRLVFYIEDTTTNTFTITGSNFDNPSRYFRELQDNGKDLSLDWEVPFTQWSGGTAKFKTGYALKDTDRDFQERIFTYLPDNTLFEDSGDISALFATENFDYYLDSSAFGLPVRGNIITENSKLRNNYTGGKNIQAFYGMLDMPLSSKLRVIGGVRYESTDIHTASLDTTIEQAKILEDDILPALNLVYYLKDDMNLRFAASQTLARPNLRETAPFSTKDFVGGFEIIGNPNLKRTLIQNYDVRWEWFTNPGEIFAISGFYKKLKNPIEKTFVSGTTQSNRIMTWENVENATLLGAEFEARVGLGFLSTALNSISLGGNLSLVKSEVDIAPEELNNRRGIDSTYSATTRNLQGQSPYAVNVDLSYNNYRTGTTATLFYNTFGERLAGVNLGTTPDTYEQPKHQLDFVFSQKFGPVQGKLSVKNLLDSAYKEIYKFQGNEAVFHEFKTGTYYSLGFTYSL